MRLVPASPASATPKLNSRFMTRGGWNDGYAQPCAPSAAGKTNPRASTARPATRRALAAGCERATGSDLRAAVLIPIFLREVWYARRCYRLPKRVRGSDPKHPAAASERGGALASELVPGRQSDIPGEHEIDGDRDAPRDLA